MSYTQTRKLRDQLERNLRSLPVSRELKQHIPSAAARKVWRKLTVNQWLAEQAAPPAAKQAIQPDPPQENNHERQSD